MSAARPPPSAVAKELLALDETQFPAIVQYLRADPSIATDLDRLVAEREYRKLRAGGFGSVEARRLAGERVHRDVRTLQRWGLTG